MSAVISGNGLGLFNSSLNQLGTGFGSAGLARNDEHYVNVATGNLVLRSQDEALLFRGMSIAQLRTYNSLGTIAQAGADGWVTGFERRVELVSGTLNAAGSVIRRHTGDGSYQDFTYTAANTYTATAGDGAHDTLVWSGTAKTWAWTEGSTRREETYADHADATLLGRLTRIRDLRSDGTTPIAWDVVYDASNRIAEVRSNDGTAAGDALVFGYDAGGRLESLSTRENGVLVGQVRYEYDAAGRLSAVLVDLTPQDGAGDRETWNATTLANNDGYLFRTTYTYADATSLRVAQVRRSDGTVSSYTYDANGRVRTVTRGDVNTNDADGAGQTLTFTYGAGSTDVADSTGRTWTYGYDAAGQLTQIQAPAIAGQRDLTRYTYDAAGNVTRIATTRGAQLVSQSDFSYDANGNVLWQWELVNPGVDATARAVQRTYTAANQLASETVFAGLDPDGIAAGVPTGGATTNYVYDAQNRLRFAVNAAGDVKELEYATSGNGIGQVSNAREYLGAGYSGAYTLAALTTWATSTQKANSTLVESTYDLKGRLAQTRSFAAVDANGAGIENDATAIAQFVYDAQGLLRQSIVLRSSTAAANDGRDTRQVTSYVYDGMGRLLSETMTEQVGAAAAVTLSTSTWAYVDSNNTLRATVETGAIGDGNTANDLLRIEARNAAGQVIAVTESAVSGAGTRTTQNYYDTAGRLRASQDAGGGRAYFFYDAKGDLVGQVDPTGALTETVRDAAGRVVESRGYSVRLDTTGWLAGGNVVPQTLDAVRPGWNADFAVLPPQMNTAHVGSATYPNAIVHADGRLAFRVAPNASNANPSIYSNDTHRLDENVGYRAEVTTDASMANTYLLFAIENVGASRRAAAYFRNGTLYRNVTAATGGNVSTAIGTLTANTTYVVEAQTRDGAVDYWVYVKGQDRSTGFTFSVDAEAADWGPARLRIYGYMTPGVTGNALYLDNLALTDPGVRRSLQTYDGTGRLLTQTDAEGAVTTFAYDGAGRLVQARTTDAAGTAASARVTRVFYDNAGRELARLDAEGFLTEVNYDRAGRRIRTIAYANATPAAQRAAGTLAQLRPAGSGADQITRTFYDGRGNVVAALDAEGHLTEYVYDEARNQRAIRRNARQLTAINGTETLAALQSLAAGGPVLETRRSFDARGLLQIEVDAEGTVTRYGYDAVGRLLKTEAGQGTAEQRDVLRRYDVFGNVIAELGGEGAAKITAGMTAAQIDAIYAQYGVRHAYDALGRRIETTDPLGNRTWYFHDALGRVIQTVRGVQNAAGTRNAEGEVVETRYDAFGAVRDSIAYTQRITIASPYGRDQVGTAVRALRYIRYVDSRVQLDYDRRGRLVQQIDAENFRTTYGYSAFGDLIRQTQAIDAANSVVTRYDYDRRGLRTQQVADAGGIEQTVSSTYDAFGRAATLVDARGTVTTLSYDRLGRQVAQQRTVSGRVERTQTAYDAWSRVTTQTDAQGRVTRFVYDDAARSIVMTTPEGVATTTIRTRHGEVERVVDDLGNVTRNTYDRDGRLTSTIAPDGGTTRHVYDARGLVIETFDATDRKVAFEYDAAGRMTARIEDPAGLALATRYTYDGQGRQIRIVAPDGMLTTMSYDMKGQLQELVRDANGLALATYYRWDARGLQLSVTEGGDAEEAVTVEYAYDALGRRIGETVAPGVLDLTTTYAYDDAGNLVTRTDAAGRVTRYTYDEANRRVFAVDGAGGVVRNWYDADGRLVATRGYATAISTATLALETTTAAVQALVAADDARDVQQYKIYDRDGRVALTIDGAGAVARTVYDDAGRQVRAVRHANAVALTPALRTQLQLGTADAAAVLGSVPADAARDRDDFLVLDAAGRVRFMVGVDGSVVELRYDLAGRTTQTWSYGTALALSASDLAALGAGTMTVAALMSRVAGQASTASMQASVFDAAGRERYSLQRIEGGAFTVRERQYDSAGRVIAQTVYGTTIAASTAQTEAAVGAAVSASLSSDPQVRATQVRVTRMVYDAAGRQRFVIDASGAISETRYDAASRAIETRVYEQRPQSVPVNMGMLELWTHGQEDADVRRTRTAYDAAGRVSSVTDAAGNADRYGYDGTGLVVQHTDRNGAVWNYGYDAAGRRVTETSPAVTVATVSASGTVTPVSRRIVTRTEYDAHGNVVKRTENADTAEARATEYRYDNRGNQIRTIFPDAWRINEATGELEASGQRPTIDVVYDTLGQAVAQKDVRGHYSYKVYDQQGRLSHEIDQEGYVTAFGYDAYGQRTSVRRHAVAINTVPLTGWTAGQGLTAAQMATAGVLTASAADRTITKTFDARGYASSVVESSVTYYDAAGVQRTGTPTTTFEYDAYGQLRREAVLLEGTAGQASARWADTFHFYDVLGRNVLTVDAEGYATAIAYNATGEAIETIEYARALADADRSRGTLPPQGDAVSGYDRIVRWQYDALGRKEVETVVRRYQRADGSAGVRNVDTRYAYDGEGRVTDLTTDAGTTTTRYDALGRMVSLQEPVRAVLTATAENSLLASTGVDLTTASLYEQASPYTTIVYDAFGNAVQTRRYANGLRPGQSAPVADNARDQIETTRYDRQGRAVMVKSAEGAVIYTAYDEADHITHMWYRLSGSAASRDAVVHGRYTYDRTGRQITATQSRTQTSGSTTESSETAVYNGFGEITGKTFAGMSGSLSYVYDNAGRLQTTNEGGIAQRYDYNLAGHQVRESHKVHLGAGNVVDAVTFSTVDRLGRATTIRLPAHGADTAAYGVVDQQFDRWGNVVQVIDARGFQTNYRYNDFNQVIRDERPLVEVVAENGTRSWVRPVNEWFYDSNGRLVATRDANGNVRANEYDAVGRQLASKDAYGHATRYAYDALGNQRITQNPLGYLTFKTFDRQGRVTAIGDYLPGAAGTTRVRAELQRYVLNQNGDRVRVTDALGYAALYDYDGSSQLVRSQTSTGLVMEYAYDARGNRTLERYPRVTDNSYDGYWTTDAQGYPSVWVEGWVDDGTRIDRENETVRVDENTWDYDVFGRLVDHNNLGTRDHDYSYDAASGQLIGETAGGGTGAPNASKTIRYYASGRVREVVENGGASTYRYEYDAAGNRTLEETITRDAGGRQIRTITRTLYDSHNRIQRVWQDDLSSGSKRVFDLTYAYDAVGNRRQVKANSGYGPNVTAVPIVNTAPVVVQPVSEKIVRTDTTSQFTLLFSDVFRDAQQDPLTLTIAQSNGAALPAWLTVQYDARTGEVSFVAAPTAANVDTNVVVRLTARETNNASSTASTDFVVRVRANTAPVVVGSAVETIRIKTGTPWSLELPASQWFRDADIGDVLRLSIDDPSNPLPWAQIDASNPAVVRLSGTPVAGTYTLRVRATDEKGASVVKTFQFVATANAAPALVAAPAPTEAIVGRDFNWNVALPSLFTDADGDPLQITASGMPAWMSLQYLADLATPQVKLTGRVPADEVDGRAYAITLTATDPDGAVRSTTLTVTVRINRAPALVFPNGWSLPSMRVNETLDRTIPISTLFADPEGDQILVEKIFPSGSTLPQWLTITVDEDAQTIRFSGKPTLNSLAGTFSFQLRASDPEGLERTATVSLTVGTDNAPVRNTAVALNDQTISIGRTFSFTLPAGLYSDADGDALTLSAAVVIQRSELESPREPVRTYWIEQQALPSWLTFNAATRTFSGTVPAGQAAGTLQIRVRASDGRNLNTLTATQTLHVGTAGVVNDVDFALTLVPFVNRAPIYAGTLPNRTGVEGQALDFAVPAGAFVEPDGDALTYSALVQNEAGQWVQPSLIGLAVDPATGRITGTPANLRLNSYAVRLFAADPQGATIYGQFTLTMNRKPVAPASLSRTASINQAFSYAVTGFSDPEGGALTYSAKLVGGAALPAWLTFTSAGVLSGTPTAPGTYSIAVTATDAIGLSTTTTLTLVAANDPPRYNGGLANQTPAPGSAFSYVVPASAFTDPNGDAITYTADANGAQLPAWLTFNAATRTFTGTPRAAGVWTIRVLATDASGASGVATFGITVPNLAPTNPVALPDRTGTMGQTVAWTLPAGTFADGNNDALTYTLMVERPGYWEYPGGGGGGGGIEMMVVMPEDPDLPPDPEPEPDPEPRWIPPAWVAASQAGLTIHATTGAIGGTLDALYGDIGYRAKIIARDPAGASAEAIFNVTVNLAPIAPGVPTQYARQNAAYSYVLPAFSDGNGDALTYSVSGLPAGLSFNAATRAISGTPTAAGSVLVTYTANDGRGGVTSQRFTLNVAANTAPVAPALPAATASINAAWSYTVPAFTDADGDALTYAASGLPAGIAFNAATRVLSGTPAAVGSYTVTVTATDGRGGTASASFVVTVSNAPPPNRAPVLAVALDDQWAETGYYFEYVIPANSFVDPDGNALTYTATLTSGAALPLWLRFDAANRRFWGTPTGTITQSLDIRVTATDPSGSSASGTFNLYKQGSGGTNPKEPIAVQALDAPSTEQAGIYRFDVATQASALSLAADDGMQASTIGDPSMQPMLVQLPPDDEGGGGGGGGGGGTTTPTPTVPYQVTEYWFTYDAENRIKVHNGALVGGQIVVTAGNADSYELMYDDAGRAVARYVRVTVSGSTVDQVYRTAYDLRGNKTLEFHAERIGVAASQTGGVSKSFSYDAAGQLRETRSYYANGFTQRVRRGGGRDVDYVTLQVGGWLSGAEQFTYDTDGRLMTQLTKARTSWPVTTGLNQRTDLAVLTDKTKLENTYSNGASGYDAAGRLRTYRYTQVGSFTHTYSSTFVGWDTWQESWVNGTSSNTNYRTTSNTLTYDGFGRLASQRERTNYASVDDRMRYYAYNGDGRVQMRRAGTMSGTTFTQAAAADGTRDNVLFVHAAGQQLAELKEGGQTRLSNGTLSATKQLQSLGGVGNYAAGGGKITVGAGENLQAIAQRVYGSAQLWYVLADANGLGDPNEELIEGTQLNAPNVNVSTNDASTFKPYNPSDAVGSSTPGLPHITPPPKKGCNTLAIVLIAVVAIAVTVITAGAMAAPAAAALGQLGGAIVTGAVAGAAGSIAGQLAGMATGVVDSFSWRQVAAGAITGAITGGVASALGGASGAANIADALKAGQYGKVAILAVTNSAAGYVGNKLAGVPGTSFSWRSIAAGAVSSVVSAGIGNALGLNPAIPFKGVGNVAADFANGAIGGVVSAHTRQLFGIDEDIDYGRIVADAFGNAVGNSIGNAVVAKIDAWRLEQKKAKFDAWIEERRQSLPEEDRDNPLFYALSDEIDPAIKRDLWARYKAGDITFEREVANLGAATAAYDPSRGANGTIAINGAALALTEDAKYGAMFGAMIAWGDLQEIGHQFDEMAWRAMGVSGGDSTWDEGAIFAYMTMGGLRQQAGENGIASYQLNLGSGAVSLQVDAAMLGMVAMHDRYSGAMFRENRTANGIEYFNAGGHYYSTFAITYDTALAATGNRDDAYRLAQQLSLAAQLPDMIWELDAFSQYMHASPGFNDREIAHMTEIMSVFHNLAPDGQGTVAWLANSREQAGRLVTEAIASKQYVLAGFAIHKLGDSYAHTYFDDGVLLPYEAPHGHGWHSASGRDPDNIHFKPAQAMQYADDLSRRIAAGLGVSASAMNGVVEQGTRTWEMAFNGSRSYRYVGKAAVRVEDYEAGNESFINHIIRYEKSIRGSGVGLMDDQYLHVQRGATGSLIGLGTTPAVIPEDNYRILFGQDHRAPLWEAAEEMKRRFAPRR